MRSHHNTLILSFVSLASLWCGTTAAQEPMPNPVQVVITGTVKSPEGKPVKDAFVMLKSCPWLCAMTDARGSFRVAGRAHALPDRLLVSWAGCRASEMSITQAETKDLVDLTTETG